MTDTPTEHTEGLLRIGEVARMFNLSVGTLRHYEQMGLLDPAHIDPASGYRYYGSRQLSTLNTISHLRVLDLPLAQIREFVTTRDVNLMQRQLAQQQELIERKRRELERVSRKIDNRLTLLHDAWTPSSIPFAQSMHPSFAAPCCANASTPPTPMRWSGRFVNCRRGSTRPLSFWATWASGLAPSASPPVILMATTRSFCCSMTLMITWVTLRRDLPRTA